MFIWKQVKISNLEFFSDFFLSKQNKTKRAYTADYTKRVTPGVFGFRLFSISASIGLVNLNTGQ
jgi:hypothetical protein